MITIFFDKDKFSLNITDSDLEGYIRVLPLKDLMLLMGEEGLELTVLNKNRDFLYTFTEGQVTLEGVNLLGDIMGYHVALGNESNINQSIVQDTLTYIGFEYLYSFEGNLYLYYGENFNMLPTLISIPTPEPQAQYFYTTPIIELQPVDNTPLFFPLSAGSGVFVLDFNDIATIGFDAIIEEVKILVTSNSLDTTTYVQLVVNGTTYADSSIDSLQVGIIDASLIDSVIGGGIKVYYRIYGASGTGSITISSIRAKLTPIV